MKAIIEQLINKRKGFEEMIKNERMRLLPNDNFIKGCYENIDNINDYLFDLLEDKDMFGDPEQLN